MLSGIHWSPDSLFATAVAQLGALAILRPSPGPSGSSIPTYHNIPSVRLHNSHVRQSVWPMHAGFSVSGIAKEGSLMSKGGMQAGQAIILTKPLGTGTIMAAAMRRRAKGRWITGLHFYS